MMAIDPADARRLRICCRCKNAAVLSRRLDGAGWRALYWCPQCSRPAYAGDSFVRIAPNELEALPVVTARQGTLL